MTTDAERPVLDWCAQKTVVELIEEAKWAVTRWELYRRLYEALDEGPPAQGLSPTNHDYRDGTTAALRSDDQSGRLASAQENPRSPEPQCRTRYPFGAASQPHARQQPSPTEHAVAVAAQQPRGPTQRPRAADAQLRRAAEPGSPYGGPGRGADGSGRGAGMAERRGAAPHAAAATGLAGTAVDAAKQWAEGVMMGTTAPGASSAGLIDQLVNRWGAAEKPPYNEGEQKINMFLPDGRVSTADLPSHQ